MSHLTEISPVAPGGNDTNLQDQTSRLVVRRFSRKISGPWSLNTNWVEGTNDIEILNPPAHGIVAGDAITIYDGFSLMQLGVISVTPGAGFDTLRVDTFANHTFTAALTEIFEVSFDLNVNGSITPVSFRFPDEITTPPPISIDVTQIRAHILASSAMDDSLFGDLAALTYGVIGFHHRADGTNHLATIKSNGQMACFGQAAYADKAPSGFYAIRVVFRFAGQQNAGVALRVEPGYYLELIVQDDLSSLDAFNSIVIGHIVVP